MNKGKTHVTCRKLQRHVSILGTNLALQLGELELKDKGKISIFNKKQGDRSDHGNT